MACFPSASGLSSSRVVGSWERNRLLCGATVTLKWASMSRIDFYTHVAEPQNFACLLAATVIRKRSRMLVVCDSEQQLGVFSRQLWSFRDTCFVPHCVLDAEEAVDTPIWLTVHLPDELRHPVLLNLGSRLLDRVDRFDRVLEIVGRDEALLESARLRFKTYRECGYSIEHHNMHNK